MTTVIGVLSAGYAMARAADAASAASAASTRLAKLEADPSLLLPNNGLFGSGIKAGPFRKLHHPCVPSLFETLADRARLRE